MHLKVKSRYTAVGILIAIPALVTLASIVYAGSSGKTITIVGGDSLKVNQQISSDFRFLPNGEIHVKQGDTIVLVDTTGEPHTMTLVNPSLLPTTFSSVFTCGSVPTDVCASVFAAHGFGTIPYVDDGSPSATPPNLNAVFTGAPATGGDSVLIFPGQSIVMTVTAPPGTVLHFICVIHPWMQGEIVVDS